MYYEFQAEDEAIVDPSIGSVVDVDPDNDIDDVDDSDADEDDVEDLDDLPEDIVDDPEVEG